MEIVTIKKFLPWKNLDILFSFSRHLKRWPSLIDADYNFRIIASFIFYCSIDYLVHTTINLQPPFGLILDLKLKQIWTTDPQAVVQLLTMDPSSLAGN